MRNKRAFTLIELLVVIAIIAILAAILFPVFAQAKVAAKGAASLSNAKQETLAAIMYAGDYDDVQLLVGFPDPTATYAGIRPWSSNMLPYMKSLQIYGDPLTSFRDPGFGNMTDAYIYAPQYTYAWQVHSPGVYYGGSYITWGPISQTSLANPADTVFMLSKRTAYQNTEWWWGTTFVVMTAFTVGTPYCGGGYTNVNPNSLCGPGLSSWGIGSIGNVTTTREEEGDLSTGVTARKSKQSILTFADGHAKTMGLDKMASGTNYNKTQNQSATIITDKSKYMWDAD